MSTDWRQVAVVHFFHNFTLLSGNGFPGFMEFLPGLYGARPDSNYFRSAVEAISMASLAQVQHMGGSYLRQARKTYGLSLHHLRAALNDSREVGSPAVLATVYLLWKYDVGLPVSLTRYPPLPNLLL
jgi:hypothetical protein